MLLLRSPDATAALEHLALKKRKSAFPPDHVAEYADGAVAAVAPAEDATDTGPAWPRGCGLSTPALPTELPAAPTYTARPATDEPDEPVAAPLPPRVADEEATAEAPPPAAA